MNSKELTKRTCTMLLTIAVCSLSLALLCGCTSTKQIRQSQILINNGMIKQEVLDIMGVPGDRQFKGDDEAWQYCSSALTTFEFVIVWFFKGHVTGINTYKTYNCPSLNCKGCFRSVNWEEAPDRIIEFRNKEYKN